MGTISNPILFALRDLGTSVRTIFQDEAARRQAALAAQGQENEQRRVLESLRLTGEQQLAKLGIEEAKTRFEINRGEKQLDIQQQQINIAGAAQRATETYQTGQLRHLQADLDLRKTVEQNQQILRVAQTNAANAQQTLALTANKTEEEKLRAANLVNEANTKLSTTQVNLHGMMEALIGGKTASESDKAFLAAFLGNAEQRGFITAEATLPYNVAQPVAKGLLELRSAVEKSDEALSRRLYSDIGVKLLQAGKSNEEIAEYFDFVKSYAQDREGTSTRLRAIQGIAEQLRPVVYQQKKITDPSKMPLKQKTEIDKELYNQARRIYEERTGGGAAGTTPPPRSPPLPALSGVAAPAIAAPLVQASPQVAEVLTQALAKKFVGGKIPNGPHVVSIPGLEPGHTERFAVRVVQGRIVDLLPIEPPKAR